MAVIRILLISHLLGCLMATTPTCRSVSYCVPFTGCNDCVKENYTEPDLPPTANACCGPDCTYGALNGDPGVCSNVTRGRCLLDTHCVKNISFSYVVMSECELRQKNVDRMNTGFARYLSFNWTEPTCLAQNTKCGINCCCRETCPTKFCEIETVTVCP